MPGSPSTLSVVLQDVIATYPLPVSTEPARFDDSTESVWISTDGVSKAGITVDSALSLADRLAHTADAVADWLVECLPTAGYPALWPICPLHPNTHPLEARADHSTAAWICPKTNEPVARVGELSQA